MTAGATALIVAGSWAVIGFKGLTQYPRLMAADAKAFEAFPFSSSIVHVLSPLGLSIGARERWRSRRDGTVRSDRPFARGSDEGWFAGALTLGVLCSPVVWLHYEVVLFVPLALARRRPVLMWAVIAYSYWFILLFLHTAESRAIALTAVMVCSVVWATMEPRSATKAQALDASV